MGGDEGDEDRQCHGEGDEGRAGDEGDEDREPGGDEGDEDREPVGEGDEGRAGDEGDEGRERRGEGDEGRAGDEGDEEVSCWGKLSDACASSGVWLSPHGRRAWVAESIDIFSTSSAGHGPLVCRLRIVCPPFHLK